MADPIEAANTQLKNILSSTGKKMSHFVADIKKAGIEKHGQMVTHFKELYELGHGNANLLAHKVREELAGGVAKVEDLLSGQFAGPKAELLPLYAAIEKYTESLGKDVEKVIQKTGVTFRRGKNFLVVNAASAKRLQLGLNLDETPSGERCVPTKGMCNHKASLNALSDFDKEVKAWIKAAYQRLG